MSEEEAITKLKSIVKVHNDFLENCEKETISKDEIEAIETVLSILEDKKQKIRRLYKESNQVFNENEKLKEKLEETKANEYECNNRVSNLLDEIKKKDKIIDEMAKEISKSIINTCPYADYNEYIDCEKRCSNDDNVIAECWKKYFKEKVENETYSKF